MSVAARRVSHDRRRFGLSVDRRDSDVAPRGESPDGLAHGGDVVAAERFAVRSGLALLVVGAIGVGFGVLALLARARWEPMQAADQEVIDQLVGVVADNGVLRSALTGISRLGETNTLVVVLAVSVIWLWLRRQPRLAVYVILTSAGGFILNLVVKELVARLRPVVQDPVYTAYGWSFPSGHTMNSLVCYGILLLVFAPALRSGAQRAVTALAVVVVLAIGLSRIALGAHYPSDVLGGWLLGSLWLVLATVAFHRWRRDSGIAHAGPLPGDLTPDDEDDLRPVPVQHPPLLSHPWRGIGELAVGWVLLVGLLLGLGMAVRTLASDTTVLQWDNAVVATLAEHRNPTLNSVLGVFEELGNTVAVIVVALIVAVLAVGALRSWRPALFLGVAMLGEITLFLTTAAIVDRDRPRVQHLNPNLPPTASFPSGHVAASMTLYAGTAALLWFSTRRWQYRIVAVIAVLIPVLVAVQRLYAGAHHPTDILGAIVLSAIWTTIAWWVVQPASACPRARVPKATRDCALPSD